MFISSSYQESESVYRLRIFFTEAFIANEKKLRFITVLS